MIIAINVARAREWAFAIHPKNRFEHNQNQKKKLSLNQNPEQIAER